MTCGHYHLPPSCYCSGQTYINPAVFCVQVSGIITLHFVYWRYGATTAALICGASACSFYYRKNRPSHRSSLWACEAASAGRTEGLCVERPPVGVWCRCKVGWGLCTGRASRAARVCGSVEGGSSSRRGLRGWEQGEEAESTAAASSRGWRSRGAVQHLRGTTPWLERVTDEQLP
eukprot:COSAG06_NODE_3662_length_5052_cov_16.029667_3_plen_175_part_00